MWAKGLFSEIIMQGIIFQFKFISLVGIFKGTFMACHKNS